MSLVKGVYGICDAKFEVIEQDGYLSFMKK